MPKKLMRGIRHFKNNLFQEKQDVFRALSQGQNPDVLFITCSDSRIDPILFTHADIGELFVLRNAGNIVAPVSLSRPANASSGEAATIEFALAGLNIQDIVICGHSKCGAMAGLLNGDIDNALPETGAWLKHASIALERLKNYTQESIVHPENALKCLTQENIILQMEHLKSHPVVKSKLAEGELKIHGWYYEFDKGEVYIYNEGKRAFISFEQTIIELSKKTLADLIDTEALKYIKDNYSAHTPKTQQQLNHLIKQIKRSNSINEIWAHIKPHVTQKLQDEMRELFKNADETNAQVDALIHSGASVPLRQLSNLNRVINKLLFQFHLHDARQHFFSENQQKAQQRDEHLQMQSKL